MAADGDLVWHSTENALLKSLSLLGKYRYVPPRNYFPGRNSQSLVEPPLRLDIDLLARFVANLHHGAIVFKLSSGYKCIEFLKYLVQRRAIANQRL